MVLSVLASHALAMAILATPPQSHGDTLSSSQLRALSQPIEADSFMRAAYDLAIHKLDAPSRDDLARQQMEWRQKRARRCSLDADESLSSLNPYSWKARCAAAETLRRSLTFLDLVGELPQARSLIDSVYQSIRWSYFDDDVTIVDLNGDGVSDTLTVVARNDGGSANFVYLRAQISNGTTFRAYRSRFEEDRAIVDSVVGYDRTVSLFYKGHGSEDATCCPSVLRHLDLAIDDFIPEGEQTSPDSQLVRSDTQQSIANVKVIEDSISKGKSSSKVSPGSPLFFNRWWFKAAAILVLLALSYLWERRRKRGHPLTRMDLSARQATQRTPPEEKITCHQCGAKNSKSSARCWMCSSSLIPNPPAPCYNCGKPLQPDIYRVRATGVLLCAQCGPAMHPSWQLDRVEADVILSVLQSPGICPPSYGLDVFLDESPVQATNPGGNQGFYIACSVGTHHLCFRLRPPFNERPTDFTFPLDLDLSGDWNAKLNSIFPVGIAARASLTLRSPHGNHTSHLADATTPLVAENTVEPTATPPPRRVPCPSCAEPIRVEAKVCRFCGRETGFGQLAGSPSEMLNDKDDPSSLPPDSKPVDTNPIGHEQRHRVGPPVVGVTVTTRTTVPAAGSNNLIDCGVCGNEIAALSAACPACGAPNDWVHPRIRHFSKVAGNIPMPRLWTWKADKLRVQGESRPSMGKVFLAGIVLLGVLWLLDDLYGVASGLLAGGEGSFFLVMVGILVGVQWLGNNAFSKFFKADLVAGTWSSNDEAFWRPVYKVLMGTAGNTTDSPPAP